MNIITKEMKCSNCGEKLHLERFDESKVSRTNGNQGRERITTGRQLRCPNCFYVLMVKGWNGRVCRISRSKANESSNTKR